MAARRLLHLQASKEAHSRMKDETLFMRQSCTGQKEAECSETHTAGASTSFPGSRAVSQPAPESSASWEGSWAHCTALKPRTTESDSVSHWVQQHQCVPQGHRCTNTTPRSDEFLLKISRCAHHEHLLRAFAVFKSYPILARSSGNPSDMIPVCRFSVCFHVV